jgi:hypothetical protein
MIKTISVYIPTVGVVEAFCTDGNRHIGYKLKGKIHVQKAASCYKTSTKKHSCKYSGRLMKRLPENSNLWNEIDDE